MANRLSQDQTGRTIEVKKSNLIAKLEENRKKHILDYNEAVAGYIETATKKLEDAYNIAKKKMKDNVELAKIKIQQFDKNYCKNDYLVLIEGATVELKSPQNFVEQYNTAIEMFQWDVRETIQITHAEFKCFIEDKWDWTDNFTAISAMYKKF